MKNNQVIILGAGPAGLAAALELTKKGQAVTVLEKDELVGGLAKTVNHHGYYFDIGGHRFFTKNSEVQSLWQELLGAELIERQRLSRIYYNKRFFNYPLKPINALVNLGFIKTFQVLLSFGWVRLKRIFKKPEEKTFADWVTNRFGKVLFEIFFKTYTEKVWGISTTELGADWAAQRIKGLSLSKAIIDALGLSQKGKVKTLIDKFQYPRLGPGLMYGRMAEKVKTAGGQVELNQEVLALRHQNGSPTEAVCKNGGQTLNFKGDYFLSSLPITVLVKALEPAVPLDVQQAVNSLKFRGFITVVLIINRPQIFPDNWIYIHSPEVKVGRMQNFKNWSEAMVPNPATTSLGLEYFANAGDDFWNNSDEQLLEIALKDLTTIGFAKKSEVLDYAVVRMPDAYPVYQMGYEEHLEKIKNYLKQFKNLQLIGRGGMFRYNNMDHSIISGIYAARNILGASYDIWKINADAEYLEERRAV